MSLVAMALFAVHSNPLAITKEGLAKEKKVETGGDWTSIELFVIASLQLALVFIAYRLDRAKTPLLISESVCGMFLGLLVGVVIRFVAPEESVKMDPQVLFYAILPPIILEAGFSMKKRGFFTNFSTILLLAVVGTLIAMFAIGGILLWLGHLGLITQLSAAEAYLYGALISAVDPVATLSVFKKNGVPPLLFNLVFGESMLNDGVAIVAFTLFQRMIRAGATDVTFHELSIVISQVFVIGIGSVCLATVVCCTSAFLLKRADTSLHEHPAYELSIVLLSAYLSYVAADMAGLSGIVALFFSAVLMSHYHLYTISEDSAKALRHFLATAAFVAENFVFIYLGMSVAAYSSDFTWDWGFILCNLVVIMIARMLSTFPLIAIANCGRKQQIPWSFMVVIWFAGLRGAIAFALALNVWTPDPEHAKVIQSTTLFTVMFTTVVFGMGTSPLLRHYRLSHGSEREVVDEANESLLAGNDEQELGHFRDVDEDEDEEEEYRKEDHPSRFPSRKRGGIHGLWQRLDEKHFKPLFGGLPRSESKSMQHERSGASSSRLNTQSFTSSTQSLLTMAQIAQDYDKSQR